MMSESQPSMPSTPPNPCDLSIEANLGLIITAATEACIKLRDAGVLDLDGPSDLMGHATLLFSRCLSSYNPSNGRLSTYYLRFAIASLCRDYIRDIRGYSTPRATTAVPRVLDSSARGADLPELTSPSTLSVVLDREQKARNKQDAAEIMAAHPRNHYIVLRDVLGVPSTTVASDENISKQAVNQRIAYAIAQPFAPYENPSAWNFRSSSLSKPTAHSAIYTLPPAPEGFLFAV